MRNIRSAAATCAVLTFALAGCGGGGGGTTASAPLPPSPTSAPATRGTAPATFVLTIPSKGASSNARTPRYIAAATQSIVVSVTGPGNATATATINTTACTSGTGGLTCTVTVQAPIGDDVFTVTAYDGPNGTGNVLSTGTKAATVVAHAANTFPLTLGGTPAALALTIATPNLPVVDGGTSQVTLSVKDAAGNEIVGTYSNPVTVTAPPGLSLLATATGTPVSSLTITGSSQTTFFVKYDGASRSALSLTAASGTANGAAKVIPTTHTHFYSGTPASSAGARLFKMIKGPDNALYFGDVGATTTSGNVITGTQPGSIGRIDMATGAMTTVQIDGINPIGLLFIGNDLYIAEQNTGSIGKIANAGAGGFTRANYVHFTLPNGPPAGTLSGPVAPFYDAPREMVYAGGKLYVTCLYSSQVAVVDITNGATTYVRTPVNIANPANHNERPQGIALLGSTLYITEGQVFLGRVSKLPVGGTTMTDVTDTVPQNLNGGTFANLRFIVAGPDGKLYITWNGDGSVSPALTQYDGGTTFTALPVPSPDYTFPDTVRAGSGSTIVFSDLNRGNGIGSYDTASGNFRLYPIGTNPGGALSAGAQDVFDPGDASYWFTAAADNGSATAMSVIGHLVFAEGWQVLPEAGVHIDGTGPTGAALLAIAQSPASTATVTVQSTTPSICTVAPIARYIGNYAVTGVTTGTCTVTATDQNQRTVTTTIPVVQNTATITGARRLPR